MGTKEELFEELDDAPDPMLEQVLAFVRFLKEGRHLGALETVVLSESALAKDWLRPEEDEAWSHL